jgi:ferredoxin
MPTVTFEGTRIECERGEVLRDVLLDAGESPHNGATQQLNCRGHATCGTCAIAIDGAASEMENAERRRLSAFPHSLDSGLRLACQTHVEGDLAVEKHGGFWGQHVENSDE